MRSQCGGAGRGSGVRFGRDGPRKGLHINGIALGKGKSVIFAADKHFRAVQDFLSLGVACRVRHCPSVCAVENDYKRFFPFKIVTATIRARVVSDFKSDAVACQVFGKSRGDYLESRKNDGAECRSSAL